MSRLEHLLSWFSLAAALLLPPLFPKLLDMSLGSGMHRGDLACRSQEVAALVVDRRVKVRRRRSI